MYGSALSEGESNEIMDETTSSGSFSSMTERVRKETTAERECSARGSPMTAEIDNRGNVLCLLQGFLATSLVGIALWLPAHAQDRGASATKDSASARVSAGGEYTPPHTTRMLSPGYPDNLRRDGVEGWAQLTMMVDRRGRAHEVDVLDSSGLDALDRAAVDAMATASFAAGSINGTPVDAVHAHLVVFALTDSDRPSREFIELINAVGDAQMSNDRARADEIYAQIKPRTLTELGLVDTQRQSYYNRWGSPHEELMARKRVTVHASVSTLTPVKALPHLRGLFEMQLRLKHFGDALKTWEKLRKARVDQEFLEAHRASIDDIAALRADDRSFVIEGEILGRTSWFQTLLKRKFQISVSSGRISQLRLRCERDYVVTPFQAYKQYETKSENGRCELQVIGDLDTKFRLVQS